MDDCWGWWTRQLGVSIDKNNLIKLSNQNVSNCGIHLQKKKNMFTVARPTTTCNPTLLTIHESLSHKVHIKLRFGNHLLGFTTKMSIQNCIVCWPPS